MNKSGEPSVTQLIKSINKFDGTEYIEWTRSTRAIISLMHPGIADILNGVERPVEISDGEFSEVDRGCTKKNFMHTYVMFFCFGPLRGGGRVLDHHPPPGERHINSYINRSHTKSYTD